MEVFFLMFAGPVLGAAGGPCPPDPPVLPHALTLLQHSQLQVDHHSFLIGLQYESKPQKVELPETEAQRGEVIFLEKGPSFSLLTPSVNQKSTPLYRVHRNRSPCHLFCLSIPNDSRTQPYCAAGLCGSMPNPVVFPTQRKEMCSECFVWNSLKFSSVCRLSALHFIRGLLRNVICSSLKVNALLNFGSAFASSVPCTLFTRVPCLCHLSSETFQLLCITLGIKHRLLKTRFMAAPLGSSLVPWCSLHGVLSVKHLSLEFSFCLYCPHP